MLSANFSTYKCEREVSLTSKAVTLTCPCTTYICDGHTCLHLNVREYVNRFRYEKMRDLARRVLHTPHLAFARRTRF